MKEAGWQREDFALFDFGWQMGMSLTESGKTYVVKRQRASTNEEFANLRFDDLSPEEKDVLRAMMREKCGDGTLTK